MSDLVPAAVLVAVGTTEAVEIINGKGPTFKPIIAGFILGAGLYGLYGLSPELGHSFSILVIVSALLINGQPLFNKLNLTPSSKAK